MSLNISSEKIGNPLLIDLLRQLNHTFSRIGNDFFVIGATALFSINQFYFAGAISRHMREPAVRRSARAASDSGVAFSSSPR